VTVGRELELGADVGHSRSDEVGCHVDDVKLGQVAEEVKVDPVVSIIITMLDWAGCFAHKLWRDKTEMFDVVHVLGWNLDAIGIQVVWSCGTLLRQSGVRW
jgi:hypothetical protein